MSKVNLSNILSSHVSKKEARGKQKVSKSDQEIFKGILKDHFKTEEKNTEIKVSSHALKRLKERGIEFDANEYLKLKEASSRLQAKGSKDSLIVTDKAAYIFDVKKQTLVTAIDKEGMNENVFTNIDSTLFV